MYICLGFCSALHLIRAMSGVIAFPSLYKVNVSSCTKRIARTASLCQNYPASTLNRHSSQYCSAIWIMNQLRFSSVLKDVDYILKSLQQAWLTSYHDVVLDAVFDPGEVLSPKSVKAITIACDIRYCICCVFSQHYSSYFGALFQIQGYTLHLVLLFPFRL